MPEHIFNLYFFLKNFTISNDMSLLNPYIETGFFKLFSLRGSLESLKISHDDEL